jgi:hypothetical protein
LYLDYITPREKSKGNTAYFGKDDLREIFCRIKEVNRKAPQTTLCGAARVAIE